MYTGGNDYGIIVLGEGESIIISSSVVALLIWTDVMLSILGQPTVLLFTWCQ